MSLRRICGGVCLILALSSLFKTLVMLYPKMFAFLKSPSYPSDSIVSYTIVFGLFGYLTYRLLFKRTIQSFLGTVFQSETKEGRSEMFRRIVRTFFQWSDDKVAAKIVYYSSMVVVLAYIVDTLFIVLFIGFSPKRHWALLAALVFNLATYTAARNFLAGKRAMPDRMILFPLLGTLVGLYSGGFMWSTLLVALLAQAELLSPRFQRLHPVVKAIVVAVVFIFAEVVLEPSAEKLVNLQRRS